MRGVAKTVLSAVLGTVLAFSVAQAYEVPAHEVPVPDTVSDALKKSIERGVNRGWNHVPKDAAAWNRAVANSAAHGEKRAMALASELGVTVEEGTMAGVKVFTLLPSEVKPENQDRLLLHIHGGGYVFSPGKSGIGEGVMMAAQGGYKVISIDYRMAPDHPYPAALDDAMAVYKAALEQYPADRIGVFGTSTGGGMTLALVLRAKAEGLPLPGAIAPGTPWSDLTKTGDSYYTHEGLDTVLVSYEGMIRGAAEIYAAGHDMKDPYLSPVYGDFTGFPPVLLTSGTRDIFLSNTVRVHQKMREAGVNADLLVIEGHSHAGYCMLPMDAAEARFHFGELDRFFSKYLAKKAD